MPITRLFSFFAFIMVRFSSLSSSSFSSVGLLLLRHPSRPYNLFTEWLRVCNSRKDFNIKPIRISTFKQRKTKTKIEPKWKTKINNNHRILNYFNGPCKFRANSFIYFFLAFIINLLIILLFLGYNFDVLQVSSLTFEYKSMHFTFKFYWMKLVSKLLICTQNKTCKTLVVDALRLIVMNESVRERERMIANKSNRNREIQFKWRITMW